MPPALIIATRESRLALWQAEHVRDLLRSRFGATIDLLPMTTQGDRVLDRTLSKVGGKGRPTPTRREAEAAAKARAKVPRTRKEMAAAQRTTERPC